MADESTAIARRFATPLVAVLTGLAAFIITIVVAFFGYKDASEFHETPYFLIWVVLFSAQWAIWLAAFFVVAPLRRSAQELKQVAAGSQLGNSGDLLAIVLIGGLAAGVFLPTLGYLRDEMPFTGVWAQLPTCDEWAFKHTCPIMLVVLLFGVVIALFAVAGMYRVRRLLLSSLTDPPPMSDVKNFIDLRRRMLLFLTIAGVAIGVGTLVIAAFQVASDRPQGSPRAVHCASLKAAGSLDDRTSRYCRGAKTVDTERSFEPEFVLLFGLYFSALLMLAYAPAHFALVASGRRLEDTLYELTVEGEWGATPYDHGKMKEWQEGRTLFSSWLQLNAGATNNFKSAVAIFTPLLASLLGLLLNFD